MNLEDKKHVNTLCKFLIKKKKINQNDFAALLYSIPKKIEFSVKKNSRQQLHFFRNVYQLLFGKDSGPRLAQFLPDASCGKVCELLDV